MAGPDFAHEARWLAGGIGPVAGVDEAGRGPLAGPVAAAAVVLDPDDIPPGLDDSKKLSAIVRERLFDEIVAKAASFAIALVPPADIDRWNIRVATLAAMCRAVENLACAPAMVLVDGRDPVPGVACRCIALVGGDGLSLSVAAASILAKVTRDRMMARLDLHAPSYGFARHSGYGTARHRAALDAFGASPWHRRSFAPLRETGPGKG